MVYSRSLLQKSFNWKDYKARVALEVNNLFSQDYDVILNYPMPKRNYRLTLTFEMNNGGTHQKK